MHTPNATLDARTVLNLGCGRKAREDAINVDLVPGEHTDVVHDLDVLPWPFENDQFSEVLAFDVIEHLDRLVPVMEEIHRVMKPGGVVRITVPHFSSSNAFTDITHRHYFGRFSFDYFTGENEFGFYTRVRFRRRVATIIFRPTLLNKLIGRLANWSPARYERSWPWIFPAWFLYFELEVVKNAPEANGHVC